MLVSQVLLQQLARKPRVASAVAWGRGAMTRWGGGRWKGLINDPDLDGSYNINKVCAPRRLSPQTHRPVTGMPQPMTRISRPMTRISRPMTRFTRPVTRISRSMTRISQPLTWIGP